MAIHKLSITERALIQRINRALAKRGERLKKARGESAIQDVGEYFIIDIDRNAIVHTNVSVIETAKELGCVQPFERALLGR